MTARRGFGLGGRLSFNREWRRAMPKTTKKMFKNLAYRLIHRLIKRHIYAEFYHLDDGTHYGLFSFFGYVYSSWLIYEDRKVYTVFSLTFEDPSGRSCSPVSEFETLIQLQIREYEATNRHGPGDHTFTVSPDQGKK
jgi:hypothetical protein